MIPPRYQDIPPEDVPEVLVEGGRVRIIAGDVEGTPGPIQGIVTNPTYLDVTLEPGATFTHGIPAEHNSFVYVFDGEGRVGITESGNGTEISAGTLAILEDGDAVRSSSSDQGLRFLILAAKPIGEPIARYGPFVMTTAEELEQAFADYRNGTLQ